MIVRFVDIDGIADHHYLIQHKQNIFFVTSLSVSLHNLLDFYIYIRLKIKPNSVRIRF